ncbi:MAG: hypothetical protein L6367_06615 [Cellulomonas sp.]|nr:hypothetical protein [Cellulomonas sp.]
MPAVDHVIVDTIPSVLKPRTLYLCLEHDVVVHLCMCGCSAKVVTPLGPAEWSVSYDENTVSLRPSIGNGALACRSHYWITRSDVRWLPQITEREQRRAYARDERDLLAQLERDRRWWRRLVAQLSKRWRSVRGGWSR